VECVKEEKIVVPSDDDLCEVLGDAVSMRGNEAGAGRYCYKYNAV